MKVQSCETHETKHIKKFQSHFAINEIIKPICWFETTVMKSLAIGFIILCLIILIVTVTTVVVMLMSRDSEKTTITTTTTSTTTQNTRCFYPDFDFQQRIVGGVELAVSNIPWQVQILVDDTYPCEGTILDDLTILSAAHCFEYQYTPSSIRAGSIKYGNGGQVSYSY